MTSAIRIPKHVPPAGTIATPAMGLFDEITHPPTEPSSNRFGQRSPHPSRPVQWERYQHKYASFNTALSVFETGEVVVNRGPNQNLADSHGDYRNSLGVTLTSTGAPDQTPAPRYFYENTSDISLLTSLAWEGAAEASDLTELLLQLRPIPRQSVNTAVGGKQHLLVSAATGRAVKAAGVNCGPLHTNNMNTQSRIAAKQPGTLRDPYGNAINDRRHAWGGNHLALVPAYMPPNGLSPVGGPVSASLSATAEDKKRRRRLYGSLLASLSAQIAMMSRDCWQIIKRSASTQLRVMDEGHWQTYAGQLAEAAMLVIETACGGPAEEAAGRTGEPDPRWVSEASLDLLSNEHSSLVMAPRYHIGNRVPPVQSIAEALMVLDLLGADALINARRLGAFEYIIAVPPWKAAHDPRLTDPAISKIRRESDIQL